ncbi:MAG TPA: DUF6351 family protein [Acidimicrobiales bacterium]
MSGSRQGHAGAHRSVAGLVVVAMAAAVPFTVPSGVAAAPGRAAPSIAVLSSDADKVTGGDALVEVTVADPGAARTLRVVRDGTDVTSEFTQVAPRRFRGVVEGLPDGESTLVATTTARGAVAAPGRSDSLEVTSHPIAGPVFSGPHQEPFYCETEQAGLGEPQDEDCFAPTQVAYRYRTTAGSFAPLADPGDRPGDLAMVTIDGEDLPYIVRLERGVINRGIYEIAALYDGEDPSPVRDETGWNGRLVMTFGGGCNVGYHQGSSTAGVLNHMMLSRGYAVASNSLLVNETNCDPVSAAETAMMTKERVIEAYGPLAHTIGWGGSGGAIMQYTITHAYPGILDGLLPSFSYADAASNAGPPDCALLMRYLSTPSGSTLSPAQRQAIGGHRTFVTCQLWVLTFANRIDATTGCPAIVPASTWYDPVTNPTGVRCSLADHWITQLGEADDGFAPDLFDNDGVQYGLAALNEGIIDVDEFLDLNESIGGFDRDGVMHAERSTGDAAGIQRAYETGLVTSGHGGLAHTPTIDLRVYTDAIPDIHTSFWSVAMHERLVRDGVDPRLHVRWIFSGGDRGSEALDAMEEWLNAIAADTGPGTPAELAARNRPASATDGCWPTPAGPKVEDLDACYAGPFPYSGDLRTVAGAPITSDVTCQKKPVDLADYAVAFTQEQEDHLNTIFPNGVCDYSLPGVGQVPLAGTWQRYP